MERVKLEILGISFSKSGSDAYALLLGKKSPGWHIPVIIGPLEAQSIAMQMEGMKPPRPQTHDLFVEFARAFGIEIKEVEIHEFKKGVFFAKILCESEFHEPVLLDARTSDAVALALRFRCPVYIAASILDIPGLVVEGVIHEGVSSSTPGEKDPAKVLAELERMLNEAIAREDYEQASFLRDEIRRKKGKSSPD